jgi:uncharacterized protein DUF6812
MAPAGGLHAIVARHGAPRRAHRGRDGTPPDHRSAPAPPGRLPQSADDYLNASERDFLALTDVEIEALEGAAPLERRQFVALSLSHVVLVMPAEDGVPVE